MSATMEPFADASTEELERRERALDERYRGLRASNLKLDLTRGKPGTDQLGLSDALDGILAGDYATADGTDTRNYGGLRGIPEARALGAEILGVGAEQVIAGGNSSLTLMYLAMDTRVSLRLERGAVGRVRAGEGAVPGARLRPALHLDGRPRHRDGRRADDGRRTGHGPRRGPRRRGPGREVPLVRAEVLEPLGLHLRPGDRAPDRAVAETGLGGVRHDVGQRLRGARLRVPVRPPRERARVGLRGRRRGRRGAVRLHLEDHLRGRRGRLRRG